MTTEKIAELTLLEAILFSTVVVGAGTVFWGVVLWDANSMIRVFPFALRIALVLGIVLWGITR